MKRFLRMIFVVVALSLIVAAPSYSAEPSKQADMMKNMRRYVLVVLKTGPTRVEDKQARAEMFQGHFANMERLAKDGKLSVAGPFTDGGEWRGLFILAVDSIDEAKELVATDPVIKTGEMIAEYHTLFSTSSLMDVNAMHEKAVKGE